MKEAKRVTTGLLDNLYPETTEPLRLDSDELGRAAPLDLAVARVLGLKPINGQPPGYFYWTDEGGYARSGWFAPSTDWSIGGPIIESELINLGPTRNGPAAAIHWLATPLRHYAEGFGAIREFGPTPLIAAMRAFVASKQEP